MLMSRTVVRQMEMQMRTLPIAALTLAVAVMAARAFSELSNGAIVGGNGIAHGADAGPQLQRRFVDDGY
jgi:hypothetical protein